MEMGQEGGTEDKNKNKEVHMTRAEQGLCIWMCIVVWRNNSIILSERAKQIQKK
jgi:hypothetical protein